MNEHQPDAAPAQRVEALERQVAALTARLGPAPTRAYDRRALLRRGGVVLAGAAGAVALPGAVRPAAAANGTPVLAGTANTESAQTRLDNSSTDPTLSLGNPSTPAAGTMYSSPSLRLLAGSGQLGPDVTTALSGELLSAGNLLSYTHVVGAVYTSAFANFLNFVTPHRILDTRPPSTATSRNDKRSSIVKSGPIDSAGRLARGTSIVLDLSAYVSAGAGVFGNLTAVSPVGPG